MSNITTSEDAIDRQLAVPPQLVEEVQTNPDKLVELTRAQLLLVQDKLTREYLRNPEASVNQGVAVHDALRKTANLDPKQGAGGGTGFTVNIVLGGQGQAKQGATIDVTPQVEHE